MRQSGVWGGEKRTGRRGRREKGESEGMCVRERYKNRGGAALLAKNNLYLSLARASIHAIDGGVAVPFL